MKEFALTHLRRPLILKCVAAGLLLVSVAGCGGAAGTHSDEAVRPLASPAGPNSAQPNLSLGPDGKVVLSWIEMNPQGSAGLRFASLNQAQWGEPQQVSQGDNWFVNWADFPSVTPITPTLWAAHWLVKSGEATYAYDVAVALSNTAGSHWSSAMTPHLDNTRTEHGFVSVFPWKAQVGLVWLDGRNMVAGQHHDHGEGGGAMTLRAARVGADGVLEHQQLIDAQVCDCCQTDVALTDLGPLVVYRDRSPAEVRDIYVAHLEHGASALKTRVSEDNWIIPGCPVNGPAISAVRNQVAVAWFTAANDQPRVRAAFSNDSGVSFASPIDVNVESAIGRVDVVLFEEGSAAVSWVRRWPDNRSEICVRLISASGELGPVRVIGQTRDDRPSGFPQMVRSDQSLIFAWTDTVQDRVLTASLPMAAL